MSVKRREFLRTALVGGPLVLGVAGVAPGAAALPQLGADVGKADVALRSRLGLLGPDNDPDFPQATTIAAAGTTPSTHEEVRQAFRLLWDAPRSTDHMEIARYFQNIARSNADKELYNEEWKERANPLITSFFGMTSTLPSDGDQTSWCAAFVSFVLYAAGKANKRSALSGAYRTYSTETKTPKAGDVVVFRKVGALGGQGFGHVGFFLSQTATHVELLGGNQRGGTGSTGAVTVAQYLKSGNGLELHSYRQVV